MASDEQRSRVEAELVDARAARAEHLAVLRARAKALAREPRGKRASAHRQTFSAIVFTLGEERYALNTRHVLRLGVLQSLTPLPGAKPPLHGLTQWHGDVLTVLDLRRPLGTSVRGITDLGRLIVLEGPNRRFGVLVERLIDIAELDPLHVQPLPREDSSERSLLHGVTAEAVFVVDDDALIERYGTHASTTHKPEEA